MFSHDISQLPSGTYFLITSRLRGVRNQTHSNYATNFVNYRDVSANAHDRVEAYMAALAYQFGRYVLISLSRPGCQPANLQGIWNDNPNPIGWSPILPAFQTGPALPPAR